MWAPVQARLGEEREKWPLVLLIHGHYGWHWHQLHRRLAVPSFLRLLHVWFLWLGMLSPHPGYSLYFTKCMRAQFYSRIWLCNPMDCSLPASSCHKLFRQEYWNGLLFPTLEDLPDPGMEFTSSALAVGSFTTKPPGKPFHKDLCSKIILLQDGLSSLWNTGHTFSHHFPPPPKPSSARFTVFCPWNSPGKNTGMGSHSLLWGNLPNPGIKPTSPALAGRFFTVWATRAALSTLGNIINLHITTCLSALTPPLPPVFHTLYFIVGRREILNKWTASGERLAMHMAGSDI